MALPRPPGARNVAAGRRQAIPAASSCPDSSTDREAAIGLPTIRILASVQKEAEMPAGAPSG
jgi:hypothetical protein